MPSGTGTNKWQTEALPSTHHAVMSLNDSRPLMRSERRHSLLVLCQPLIHVVAGGDLEVREWVHVMKIHIAIEVVMGQLSKVDIANRVLDVGPF